MQLLSSSCWHLAWGDACSVILYIAPVDWLHGVVSHAASAVYSAPPTSIPYCLAYASSL